MAIDTEQYYGQTEPTTGQGEWNRMRFFIQQQMLNLNTSMPVRVTKVIGGGVAPVGLVDIQILVTQITGDDRTVDHGIIPNVPYMRLQGGSNAVIIDPQVGDIGMACFCSRDISAVKNVRTQAPPGSRRAYDFSDAMYVGGFLNQTPTQYIHFTGSGILLFSPTAITHTAPEINMNADNININGNVNMIGDMDITGQLINNSTNVGSTHTHTGSPTAPPGAISNTGAPT